MDSKQQKAAIAEEKVILRAIEKGWSVSRPIGQCRYDLILDDEQTLYRTQVKWCDRNTSHTDGSIFVTCNNGPRCPDSYGKEIDLLLIYNPRLDAIIELQPTDFLGKKNLTIRLSPTKNSQQKRVFLASEHLW